MSDKNLTPEQIATIRKLFSGPCEFFAGVMDLNGLPPEGAPEIAFAGRSNVGKSSLINALTARKTLARTSNTPGRTQQLNFFDLGGVFWLVDMPGYGYAKVSKKMRQEWDDLIFSYLRGRPSLRSVFVLIDSRHGLKQVDLDLIKMLDAAGVSARIVLTKVDKAGFQELKKTTEQVEAALKKHPSAFPFVLPTSSDEGTGIPDLQVAILELIGG
ncbi:ribosome biogenesis GTP-binding protein YihA/YsxC [Micavibrio aeruginosavorus]|uniref:Probable GTP-binding protein EngB n=1 Tax=Micavibrio aeruginosavorus EPB TaxID=349215 RepID=M4VIV7_9BACT|nr:ribosome biogenesis GTP-binding protein YihA/YsxC [Micavibrio aeruginosavorus]AGH99143.1 GTP-binding protein EngB [Micavibrio aeruginosavorus EPB]